MQLLITISPAKRLHALHPEVVRERANQAPRPITHRSFTVADAKIEPKDYRQPMVTSLGAIVGLMA